MLIYRRLLRPITLKPGADQRSGDAAQDIGKWLQVFPCDAICQSFRNVQHSNLFMAEIIHRQFVDAQTILDKMARCIHMRTKVIRQLRDEARKRRRLTDIGTLPRLYHWLTRPRKIFWIKWM